MSYRITYSDTGELFLDNIQIGKNLEVNFSEIQYVKPSEIQPLITISIDEFLDTQHIEITISSSGVFLAYHVDYDGSLSTRFIKYARNEYYPTLEKFASSRAIKISRCPNDSLMTFTKKIIDTSKTIDEIINALHTDIEKILIVTENSVEIPDIKFEPIYTKDETPFRDVFLERLLRGLGYRGVRNTHGNKEYGKDFVFYENSLIDRNRYIALQAKAGDLSGKASTDMIKTLVNQIENCFLIPFPDEVNGDELYIDTVIVAISGKYTEQAQKIIRKKLEDLIIGSVIFLDKEALIDLAEKVNKNNKKL